MVHSSDTRPLCSGHHSELLFEGSLWVWHVSPMLLYPQRAQGPLRGHLRPVSPGFSSLGSAWSGAQLPPLSGFPDLAVGPIIPLKLG